MNTLWMHLRQLWQWVLGPTPRTVTVSVRRIKLPTRPSTKLGMW